MIDTVLSWLVCLLPRAFWSRVWLWSEESAWGLPLGRLAPHVFGRMIGSDAKPRKDEPDKGGTP